MLKKSIKCYLENNVCSNFHLVWHRLDQNKKLLRYLFKDLRSCSVAFVHQTAPKTGIVWHACCLVVAGTLIDFLKCIEFNVHRRWRSSDLHCMQTQTISPTLVQWQLVGGTQKVSSFEIYTMLDVSCKCVQSSGPHRGHANKRVCSALVFERQLCFAIHLIKYSEKCYHLTGLATCCAVFVWQLQKKIYNIHCYCYNEYIWLNDNESYKFFSAKRCTRLAMKAGFLWLTQLTQPG